MAADPDSRVALVSIHPRHAEAILAGRKRVEFRRASYPRATHIALYATSPVRRVVAMCRIDSIHRDPPGVLWQFHGADGGISHDEFLAYFRASQVGTAMTIGEVRALRVPMTLADVDPELSPPQSLCYLSPGAAQVVAERAGVRLGTAGATARPESSGRKNARPRLRLALIGRRATRLTPA